VAIIKHPDVRRNLLWMKSIVEGLRSFFYYMTRLNSLSKLAQSAELREANGDLFNLLTPVVKEYMAARGHEVCIQAIQVTAVSATPGTSSSSEPGTARPPRFAEHRRIQRGLWRARSAQKGRFRGSR
jgi:alkylation response protein AidB-like acyl-CoA dehydrogenase